MDKEIIYINNILVAANEALTCSDIAKSLFNQYGLRLSKTIVKNYLWSFFRNLITYDSVNYTYQLKSNTFLLSDVEVKASSHRMRPLRIEVAGPKLQLSYDSSFDIESYLKALAILNLRNSSATSGDLIKNLNRILEQLDANTD
jgi:hypothetical protein